MISPDSIEKRFDFEFNLDIEAIRRDPDFEFNGKTIITSIHGNKVHHRIFKTCLMASGLDLETTWETVKPYYAKYGKQCASVYKTTHKLGYTLNLDTLRTDPSVVMKGTRTVSSIDGVEVRHAVSSRFVISRSFNQTDATWEAASKVYERHRIPSKHWRVADIKIQEDEDGYVRIHKVDYERLVHRKKPKMNDEVSKEDEVSVDE
jgi:RNA recognition motif-containing protein